ncbi:hypothetical protein LCGC14_0659900 [marine sediment metagenome]|uniref:Uncharacterized protein n=1 Tax=marine sediment metagenome TaxID=412755 RepID=A0A0F9TFE1_9ZZZZ
MNRRSFLQALALSPIAPVLLCAKEKVLLESGLWMTREDYDHAGEPYESIECTLSCFDPEYNRTRLTVYGMDDDGNFGEIETRLV